MDFDYTKREINRVQRRKTTLKLKVLGTSGDEVVKSKYHAKDVDETESLTRDVMEERGEEALHYAMTSYRDGDNCQNVINSVID